ncbi:MAG: four helix bundle protein [Pseudomonadota bacterium]
MTLVEVIYGLTQRFPPEERFGLCHRIRRAAVSVPSCVAEGYARGSTRDYLRFIHMAMGSLAELETQLEIGRRLGFAAQEDLQRA